MLIYQVDDLVEIILASLVNLLVARQDRYVSLTVAHSDPAAVFRPTETIKRAVAFGDRFADDRHFSVCIDVPDIDVALCVTRSKDAGMSRTPLCIIDILLGAFESHNWLKLRVRVPQFDCPIH